MKLRRILPYLCLVSTVLVSCRSGNTFTEEVTCADVVVFDRNTDNGSVFLLTLPKDKNVITYTSTLPVQSQNIDEGDCVYLNYAPEGHEPYTSGPILRYSVSPLTNVKAEVDSRENIQESGFFPITVASAWGLLSNAVVYASLPYSDSKRTLKIVIDEETLSYDQPVAYLIYDFEGQPGGFSRNYYLAFNFGEMREKYEFNSILIKYHDVSAGISSFVIDF